MKRWGLLATIAVLTLAPAAGASPADDGSAGAVDRQRHAFTTLASKPETRGFWTAARMERADPLPAPAAGTIAQPRFGSAARPKGKPGFAAAPERGQSLVRRRGTLQRQAASNLGTQSHIPFTRSQVTNPTAFPQRTHGRLFISRSGTIGWCSATVVASDNASTILTAGHCLRPEGGGFVDSASFVPAYRDGRRPFGVFPVRSVGVTRQWARTGNYNFDIGAAVLRPNGQERTVQSVVGARGIAWNQPRNFFFRAFGYPINLSQGERPYVCGSRFGGLESERRPGPAPSLIGCDMTRGSSGGGWIVQDEFLNSVISRFSTTNPHVTGPYFGRAAKRLWNQASRR